MKLQSWKGLWNGRKRDDIEYMMQSTEKMLLLLQSANERLKNIQEKN